MWRIRIIAAEGRVAVGERGRKRQGRETVADFHIVGVVATAAGPSTAPATIRCGGAALRARDGSVALDGSMGRLRPCRPTRPRGRTPIRPSGQTPRPVPAPRRCSTLYRRSRPDFETLTHRVHRGRLAVPAGASGGRWRCHPSLQLGNRRGSVRSRRRAADHRHALLPHDVDGHAVVTVTVHSIHTRRRPAS